MSEYPQLTTPDGRPDHDAMDARDLAETLRIIRELAPQAETLLVETSDQQMGVGFWVREIHLAQGVDLAEADPALFQRIDDETFPYLSSIRWDGVVDEDDHGFALIDLRVGSEA